VVDVLEPPFGLEVSVVVDVPEPGVPCARATPLIKLRAATPVSRYFVIGSVLKLITVRKLLSF
jgi:hypothetical protein